MADLNMLMADVQNNSTKLKKDLGNLLKRYELLYKEANRQFMAERIASGSMDGLEDFYKLVNTIRRNKDVAGSLLRGINNLRALDRFEFVEEDVEEEPPQKRDKSKELVVNPQEISEISIPEVAE